MGRDTSCYLKLLSPVSLAPKVSLSEAQLQLPGVVSGSQGLSKKLFSQGLSKKLFFSSLKK